MSPEDVRMIVNEVLPQLQASQMATYAVAGAIGLIGGGAGAFIGSYLKKHGENKANDTHFERLSEQLRQNTLDTESIKMSLSGRNWVSQQAWISKEKYYTGLITHLHSFIHAIDGQLDCIEDPISPHNEEISDSPYYQEMAALGEKGAKGLNELRGPALVFLSERTNFALEQLLSELWQLREYSSGPRSEYLKGCYDQLSKAIDIVLDEAKRELTLPLMHIDSPE